ncbi:MAG: type II toxin-antitoxin system HigB family toxin [Candidatus Melainabacteria bacterium]|nr:type II toxin-antitoxin system HigB family toxin [Candidatus Melainabacteria bacterium]
MRMIIENCRAIDKFVVRHADARTPFAEWIEKVEAAQWTTLVDLKKTFNSADYVKGLVVFNVGGNNFRVVAEVIYTEQIVRIAKVGTHAEYDGWKLWAHFI